MTQEFIIKGRGRIAAAIGKSVRDIPALVKDQQLPAFQEYEDGPWFARADDLYIWCVWRADKSLPREWRDIREEYQHLISPRNSGTLGV
jgi:hypothetical protein